MSDYAKLIIPFINDNITKLDLTSTSGFVDLYTEDIDYPTPSDEIYLMYDNAIQNEYTIDRARRFSKMPEIKRTYVKYINNKPYTIYSFWVKPNIKNMYNGIITLNADRKLKILQFWGAYDSIVTTTLNNSTLSYNTSYTIPAMDYNGNHFDDYKLVITNKG